MNEAILPQIILVIIGSGASLTDLTTRRIPNWLSLATLVSGLAFTFHAHGSGATLNHGIHAFAALIVGMILFAVRFIGGGDAKFYAGVAAWFGLADAWRLFVVVSLWGLIALIIFFTVRRLQGKPIRRRGGGMEGVPYGVAIALGGATLALLGL